MQSITVYEKTKLETAVTPEPTELLSNAICFIKFYREFEQMPLKSGYGIIRSLVRPDDYKHLCDHWHSKERQFGSFFLNLNMDTRVAFLRMWCIEDAAFDEYLKLRETDYERFFFCHEPPVLEALSCMLIFFLNHGISERPGGDESPVRLPAHSIPRSDDERFGNSSNWGKYILGLGLRDQMDVLESILTHHGKRSQS